MTSEQSEAVIAKARLVVLTYSLVDWGGSHYSYEQSHNAFREAMQDLKDQLDQPESIEKEC